jgi:hypothetical protein
MKSVVSLRSFFSTQSSASDARKSGCDVATFARRLTHERVAPRHLEAGHGHSPSASGSTQRSTRLQRGATNIGVACGAVASMTMAALVVDVGQLLATKAELQTVSDLAAKSAAQELTRVYLTAGRQDPSTDQLTGDEKARILAAADRRAKKNVAGDVNITVPGADVEIGRYDRQTGNFVPGSTGVNAVQVQVRRDETANGLVKLVFPGLLGRSAVPLTASAAAGLSGIRYVPAGMADFPVAIGKAWYDGRNSPCETNNTITLYPTGTSDACAGWHTFQSEPANAAELKSILQGLRTGGFTSPAIDVNDTSFIFNGGTVASAFNELEQLYNAKKNSAGEMRALVPVYDREDCSNPNGWIRIIGVARAVITNVVSGSDKYIKARVECDVIRNAESGGTDFGVLAAGPDLLR